MIKQYAVPHFSHQHLYTMIDVFIFRQQIVVGEINMAEIRNFVLREKNGKEAGVFTGHQPRQAALKAANRSKGTKSKPVELRLRRKRNKEDSYLQGLDRSCFGTKEQTKMDACKNQQTECKESKCRAAR